MKQIIIKLPKLKTTKVFDTFWYFAAERQEIFYKRFNGKQYPWTDDRILNKYKFTNSYRASDRVSQYLINKVIYNRKRSIKETFFRILVFKLFNKIETWELLEEKMNEIELAQYDFITYDDILHIAMNMGEKIYSAAYIMASGESYFGQPKKHSNHLKLIELLIKDNVADKLANTKTMQGAYEILIQYPCIGPFLAYQLVTDINYSEITSYSEMEFVKAGPGAKDGIKKCFLNYEDYSEEDIIRYMVDNQENEFKRLGIIFKDLWGRKLQLIDCQNIFCEVDKYSRVAHPDIEGHTGRKRIKQTFKPKMGKIEYKYPPKWGINEVIFNK